ncbi:2-keto-4-pentenoate hydratase, partial [Dietzia sp. UBA5065]
MLNDETRATLARRLWDAEADVAPIAPLTADHPEMTPDDAFEIQLVNIRRKLDAGAVVTGHKVGLASKAMQEMMGVDEPDYGHLLDTMEYPEGSPVEAARFCFPRVEVEVGFILGADIPPEGCSQEEAAAAIEWVVPSIELIDSRIRDWKITLPDT